MKKFAILSVCLMMQMSALPASALSFFGVGPRAGYYKTGDEENGKMMFGAAARLKLLGTFGAEASIDYRSEKFADGGINVQSWPVSATALYYPLPIIYGLAGMGWHNTTIDYDQNRAGYGAFKDVTTQKVGWHFGGGVELGIGGKTLCADVRYVFIDYDFQNVPGTKDQNANFYTITVSLLFGL